MRDPWRDTRPDAAGESVATRRTARLTIPERLIQSAAITAAAFERPVRIIITKPVPCSRNDYAAGGEFHLVTGDTVGQPYSDAATVYPNGAVDVVEGFTREGRDAIT